jgi:hypothetical protein
MPLMIPPPEMPPTAAPTAPAAILSPRDAFESRELTASYAPTTAPITLSMPNSPSRSVYL